jgi:hypothetical protein
MNQSQDIRFIKKTIIANTNITSTLRMEEWL